MINKIKTAISVFTELGEFLYPFEFSDDEVFVHFEFLICWAGTGGYFSW